MNNNSPYNFQWNIPMLPPEQTQGGGGGNMWQIPMLPPQQPPAAYGPQPQPAPAPQSGGFMQNMMNMATNAAQANPNRWNIPNLPAGGGGGGGGGLLGGVSSFMENAATPLGIGLSLASSVIGFRQARKAERKAKKQAKKSEAERKRQEDAFRNLDTSNPYLNMENTMEDLTINQKQSQFQKEQFQQSQANILDSLRGAAGGSGVAALAQTMAREGQLASQRSSADIGRQEAANQQAERAEASRLQGLERQGDIMSREQEKYKTETLFGMSQQRAAADQDALTAAKQAKMDAITGGIGGAATMFAGFGQGLPEPEVED
jgi:hypothetical protein